MMSVVRQCLSQHLQRRTNQTPMVSRHHQCPTCRGKSLVLAAPIKSRCFATTPTTPPTTTTPKTPDATDEIVTSFANLDHRRALRTGFPEAVFGQGKTPVQIHTILDSMAKNVSEMVVAANANDNRHDKVVSASSSTAIIATRIDPETFNAVKSIGPLHHAVEMEYHEIARIISVRARGVPENDDTETATSPRNRQSVVVACAGTTDLPVAEEAAVTLSLSGVPVTRIYDCGVAGLHRILSALPKLRHPNVGCIIVCAGMDGALPSVVGGLVDVPVVAVPTSVGYGMSLGGVSALLTMLNSCSPGVGVVNVDNGFGGAVFAMKCLNSRQK
jgi:NCAIR mutase (PurE)-related protein